MLKKKLLPRVSTIRTEKTAEVMTLPAVNCMTVIGVIVIDMATPGQHIEVVHTRHKFVEPGEIHS